MIHRRYALFLALLAAAIMTGAAGAQTQTAAEAPQSKPAKKMKMNEPMPTRMARPGMMKGDVKKDAEKKSKEMKPMMEQEENAMPQSRQQR